MVTRVCGPGGIWLEPNFSGCTLTSSDPQQFMSFSLHYVMILGTNEDVNESIDMIKEEVCTCTCIYTLYMYILYYMTR